MSIYSNPYTQPFIVPYNNINEASSEKGHNTDFLYPPEGITQPKKDCEFTKTVEIHQPKKSKKRRRVKLPNHSEALRQANARWEERLPSIRSEMSRAHTLATIKTACSIFSLLSTVIATLLGPYFYARHDKPDPGVLTILGTGVIGICCVTAAFCSPENRREDRDRRNSRIDDKFRFRLIEPFYKVWTNIPCSNS